MGTNLTFNLNSICELRRRILRFGAVVVLLSGCTGGAETEQNQDPPPADPILSISDAAVVEGDAGDVSLVFEVRLSEVASATVSVDYATADGTASSAGDYDEVNGTLDLLPGSTTQSINVLIHGDTLFESDEQFTVTLSGPINARTGDNVANGTIGNDDLPPSISISDAVVVEGNNGVTALVFDVNLSAVSGLDATVDYATSDVTATAGGDYVASASSLTVSAGDASDSITIDVIGDTSDELDETLLVNLSGPFNVTIVGGSATGTIQNDDSPAVPVSGLDSRPANITCVAPNRSISNTIVATTEAFPNLPLIVQPTKILIEPVPDPRWFVLQKTGQLIVFDPVNANMHAVYLDLSATVRTSSEGGLLGMAFHPGYPATPEIFLSYTRDHSGPLMRSVISRFILDDVTSPGAGTVEQVIIEIDQDFDNHNGGDIAFGPDGFLYAGLGDGGSGRDPNDRAQDPRHLLGSFLRIDVLDASVSHPGNTYVIPADNPFASNAKCSPGLNTDNCPEIYAWGLRNPWRWSFDPATGALWAADVGQGNVEEIDLIERGGNYGWRCYEGTFDLFVPGCVNNGFINPVSEYRHIDGDRSITGGFVYRGSAIPELIGRYVFADFGSGRIWALLSDGQGGYTNEELIDTPHAITSFGVDQFGALYYTDFNTGSILKIIPGGGGSADNIATLLSDSGCVDPNDITQPYPGLIPYDINALFWSDGAQKDRWLGVPDGTTITIDGNDDWDFPAGTIIVKNFSLNGTLVETRHLMRHPDGVWAGYTYEWNAGQTEATRVVGGKTVLIDGQNWIYPSEGECMNCHTNAAGFSLGPETAQLNRDFTYPSTQRTANQLDSLDHISIFSSPLPGPVQDLPELADPADTSAPISDRARAYLHTNCAQCHRLGGPTPSDLDFRYTTPLANTNACDALPQAGNLGIALARIIAPGDSARSVLIGRVGLRDSDGMPPLGSNIVDSDGIALLTSWIDGLTNCN